MWKIGHTVALLLFITSLFSPKLIYGAQSNEDGGSGGPSGTNITCDSLNEKKDQDACNFCMGKENNTSTWTAIGCIPADPNELLTGIIKLAMGVAGGIAFLLILFGGMQIMTSAGNPEQLNAGRELVTSAITGLLLIIFSIFLLRFIGVNLIGIPGFS